MMVSPILILNILYVMSFICALYVGVSLQKIGKNPLMSINCYAYCLFCCNSLSGLIFGNELKNAPKAFCFFQGYMVSSLDCKKVDSMVNFIILTSGKSIP